MRLSTIAWAAFVVFIVSIVGVMWFFAIAAYARRRLEGWEQMWSERIAGGEIPESIFDLVPKDRIVLLVHGEAMLAERAKHTFSRLLVERGDLLLERGEGEPALALVLVVLVVM